MENTTDQTHEDLDEYSPEDLLKLALRGRTKLVESRDIIRFDEFAEMLGISASDLNQRIASECLFVVEHDGDRYVPAFFAEFGVKNSQLQATCSTMCQGLLDGWTMLQFFRRHRVSLKGKTPLEALRSGEYEHVLRAAKMASFV